jgi:hypothetical protein
MTHQITSTESNEVIAYPPLTLVSDGIKSLYVNWQGRPLNIPGGIPSVSCSSSGPSVLTGRNESISAIARAEIGNPNYAVKFSPMPKGQARLELTRATPAGLLDTRSDNCPTAVAKAFQNEAAHLLQKAEQAEAQAATTQPIPPQSPRRRQHKPRIRPSDGLRTKAEAAAKLGCSTKTVDGYVSTGVLHYVALGHGKKRRRKMFADADLDEFIANQTRKVTPCPSTAGRVRPTGTSTFTGKVIDFTAPRKPPTSAKRRK